MRIDVELFQSTLPCGSDLSSALQASVSRQFQSTLPCGSDFYLGWSLVSQAISIHAPLRERQDFVLMYLGEFDISIHAPLRERPQNPTLLLSTATISIHAPLRERRFTINDPTAKFIFQSTLPCGSDITLSSTIILVLLFQSTLPCGSDRNS